jgi:hypothetical protein
VLLACYNAEVYILENIQSPRRIFNDVILWGKIYTRVEKRGKFERKRKYKGKFMLKSSNKLKRQKSGAIS